VLWSRSDDHVRVAVMRVGLRIAITHLRAGDRYHPQHHVDRLSDARMVPPAVGQGYGTPGQIDDQTTPSS
jgi:hypothetical protein